MASTHARAWQAASARTPIAPADFRIQSSGPVADWRLSLPRLTGAGVTLRQLEKDDAATLIKVLTTEEVTRFISPPPTRVEGFERFIAWTHRERLAGDYACFGVVPPGQETAVGLFQLRAIGPGFETAEWGFALGSMHWGTGIFEHAARLILDFAFETVGVRRLEARAAVQNGRGNGALQKMGAYREGVLRGSLFVPGQQLDQALWSILDEDWLRCKTDASTRRTDGRTR